MQIGDTLSGGKIIWIAEDQLSGLVVAPNYIEGTFKWSETYEVTGTTNQILGEGQENTDIIEALEIDAPAFAACSALTANGYSDWYIPNMPEALKVLQGPNEFFGFYGSGISPFFWTSNEHTGNDFAYYNAVAGIISTSSVNNFAKVNTYNILPVRVFTVGEPQHAYDLIGKQIRPIIAYDSIAGTIEEGQMLSNYEIKLAPSDPWSQYDPESFPTQFENGDTVYVRKMADPGYVASDATLLNFAVPSPFDLIPTYEAKEYLKVDFSDEDSLIEKLIKASIEQVERMTGQRLYIRQEVITTSNEVYTTAIAPINSVISITDGGDPIVLDTDYEVEDATYGKIFTFGSGDPRIITLNVGYATGECPESLRLACLNLVEYWYNNRGASDIPSNVEERLSTFRTSPW